MVPELIANQTSSQRRSDSQMSATKYLGYAVEEFAAVELQHLGDGQHSRSLQVCDMVGYGKLAAKASI